MFKYNFSLLKGKELKIGYTKDNSFYGKKGILSNTRINKDSITFIFEDKQTLEVSIDVFNKSLIRKTSDTIIICYDKTKDILSGMIGFVMSDTYGFPFEMTSEMLEEEGYILDEEGFNVLKELQKEKSRQNLKFKNAF